jgi:hypothetical protein
MGGVAGANLLVAGGIKGGNAVRSTLRKPQAVIPEANLKPNVAAETTASKAAESLPPRASQPVVKNIKTANEFLSKIAKRDTWHSKSEFSQPLQVGIDDGQYIFVRDIEGKVHVAIESSGVKHTMLLGGESPTTGAGRLLIKNGKIVEIDAQSGHFQFTPSHLESVINSIQEQNFPISSDININLEVYF